MNIRKLTIFVIIFIVILTFFTGCAVESSDTAKSQTTVTEENKGFGFEAVYYSSSRQVVYREITTDVLYLFQESASGSGLAVMLNPETGKPLTYSDWKLNYGN